MSFILGCRNGLGLEPLNIEQFGSRADRLPQAVLTKAASYMDFSPGTLTVNLPAIVAFDQLTWPCRFMSESNKE